MPDECSFTYWINPPLLHRAKTGVEPFGTDISIGEALPAAVATRPAIFNRALAEADHVQ